MMNNTPRLPRLVPLTRDFLSIEPIKAGSSRVAWARFFTTQITIIYFGFRVNDRCPDSNFTVCKIQFMYVSNHESAWKSQGKSK